MHETTRGASQPSGTSHGLRARSSWTKPPPISPPATSSRRCGPPSSPWPTRNSKNGRARSAPSREIDSLSHPHAILTWFFIVCCFVNILFIYFSLSNDHLNIQIGCFLVGISLKALTTETFLAIRPLFCGTANNLLILSCVKEGSSKCLLFSKINAWLPEMEPTMIFLLNNAKYKSYGIHQGYGCMRGCGEDHTWYSFWAQNVVNLSGMNVLDVPFSSWRWGVNWVHWKQKRSIKWSFTIACEDRAVSVLLALLEIIHCYLR